MKHMTKEHRNIIRKKCSNEEDPAMPNVPTRKALLVKAKKEVLDHDQNEKAPHQLKIGSVAVKMEDPTDEESEEL